MTLFRFVAPVIHAVIAFLRLPPTSWAFAHHMIRHYISRNPCTFFARYSPPLFEASLKKNIVLQLSNICGD
jgi:hypothetical protein